MARTAPRVSFGLYALEVKQDSIPSAPDLQPFSKIADLKTDNATNLPYATYEPNFWLLDGGYKFMPTNQAAVHVGMMSLAMSDENGDFTVPPVLTIDFSVVHSSDGLTLRFKQYSGDYASVVNIKHYDGAAALIREDIFYPTSWELVTGLAVENFKQIVIEFSATNRPFRYLRLTGIDFGTLIYFEGTQIKAASVVEEIDPLSVEARFNTFHLRLYSADGAFSLINPTGYYTYLQERQPLAVYETVDNQSHFMGQYYLDIWENKSETEIEFECIDLLGILDTITYRGGLFAAEPLQDLIETILSSVGVPYDLDANLYDIPVTGWIPICSYREALQQIALAVGAYLDCSRSNALKIYQTNLAATETTYTAAITKAQKGAEQSLKLKPLITGVEVTAHTYFASTNLQTLFNGSLAVGVYDIEFPGPFHTLSIIGATALESGVNYAVLNVTSPGVVTLSGREYRDTQQVFSVTLADPPVGTKPNVLKVKEATLVNPTNGAAVCQRIYDYNQQRYLQKIKTFAPTAYQVADIVLVDTLYSQQLRCTVEKMAIDLAMGMVASVEMTGVINE